tara:strand:- start:355 stop:609 length:255 start_codon:yes stop_codon:yes gene_type:complete
MSLTKEQIETRKTSLQEDLQKNNEQIQKMLKSIDDARALGNALNGAIQQCDDFLQKVEGDVGGDADSSIPQEDSEKEKSKGSNK